MVIPNQFVQRILKERYGANLRAIEETGDKKLPDFEVLKGDTRLAVLEVKNLVEVDPNVTPGWSKDGVFHTRVDNGPSRVSSCMYKAYQQLNDFDEPKILTLVSDGDVDVGDLDEAIKGYMDYGKDSVVLRNNASRKVAEGRIRDVKFKIDLYIWINRHLFANPQIIEFSYEDGKAHERIIKDEDLIQFRITSPAGAAVLKEAFGLDAPLAGNSCGTA